MLVVLYIILFWLMIGLQFTTGLKSVCSEIWDYLSNMGDSR